MLYNNYNGVKNGKNLNIPEELMVKGFKEF